MDSCRNQWPMVLRTLVLSVSLVLLTGCAMMASLGGVHDFVLHGIVQDQYGNPVEGALIEALPLGSGLIQGRGDESSVLVTDAQGRFSLIGQGGGVVIDGISHPELSQYRRLEVLPNGRTYAYGSWAFGSVGDPFPKSTEEPVILKAWRVESYEDVATPSRAISTKPTGEAKEQTYLRLTCERMPYEGNIPVFSSWRMRLAVVGDGGFQIAEDAYLNEAPEVGYNLPFIEKIMELGDPNYRNVVDPDELYYFNAKEQGIYGAFKISNFIPFSSGDSCTLGFEILKYNKQGGRNLAITEEREMRFGW